MFYIHEGPAKPAGLSCVVTPQTALSVRLLNHGSLDQQIGLQQGRTPDTFGTAHPKNAVPQESG
jgi:hypothetical protein